MSRWPPPHATFLAALALVLLGAAAPARAQLHGTHEQPPTLPSSGPPSGGHQHPDPAGADGTLEPSRKVPAVTDADRRAAFPVVRGHTVHDSAIHSYVLLDQLEWQRADDGHGVSWDSKGWIGGDGNRFWFRTEGTADGGRLAAADVHGLFGRAISPWWDVVVGVRQDIDPGPARTWGAVGVQGLTPYRFEVEATAYVSGGGHTAARIKAEYELLVTNRLILQPLVEANLYGKDSPARGLGAGLSRLEAGARLRYEIRRELAPYLGITWERAVAGTADAARAAGDSTGGVRLAVGLRAWF